MPEYTLLAGRLGAWRPFSQRCSGSAPASSARPSTGSRWRSSTSSTCSSTAGSTKLSAPIVIYDEDQITGVRVPWDIPVEDYLFGFSMITLTLMLWVRLGDRERRHRRRHRDRRASAARSGCSPTRSTARPRPTTRWSRSRRATTTSCARRPRRSSTGFAAGADGVPLRVLDLGCGSGASTQAVLDAWALAGRSSGRAVRHRRRRLRGHGRPGPRARRGPRRHPRRVRRRRLPRVAAERLGRRRPRGLPAAQRARPRPAGRPRSPGCCGPAAGS